MTKHSENPRQKYIVCRAEMGYSNLVTVENKTLVSITLAMLIFLAGCKTQEVLGRWSAEPIHVDGKMTEWIGVPTTFFEDEGAVLGLCNDNQNLYVHLRFRNPMWAQAI